MNITDQMLTEYAVPVFISLLFVLMLFVIYNLGKEYGAGRFGTFIFLGTLVGGIFGFAMKFLVQATILNTI